ncbi:MAG TPA: peroxiredoxin, partial [Isosphaeraceae bacterium]
AAQVAAHAASFGVGFPVVKDPLNRVADQLSVERTCEVLVLDGAGRLRYRGAIDDQYHLRGRKDAPTRSYLTEALDAVLAGRTVAKPVTPVVGCPIERVGPRLASNNVARVGAAAPALVEARKRMDAATPLAVGAVTYASDVAPILQAKCQACHRPGQVGPFPLLSYDHAKRWAASMREVVDEYRMPPWHADPRFGHFANDRSLSPRERAVLMAWVDQGSPPGDPDKAPPPRTFPEGWSIGTPDVVFTMKEPFAVPAEGTVEYQHFWVPTRFAEDRWIQAAEARPGERSVVHHIGIYIDDHDPAHQKFGPDTRPVLACYFPGEQPSVFEPGIAKRIPAGADLIFEVHYTPVGSPRSDRSSVALIFAKEPVAHRAVTRGIPNKEFTIPARVADHAVRSSYTFPAAAHLLSFMPHMHLRGKDFRYTAVYPDGTSEVLLSVPAYDFAWQAVYRLAAPKRLPRGTRVDCLAHFDNSADNPANPDPDQAVSWGEQSWEEMMIGYIDYYEDGPSSDKDSAGADRRGAED